ncbi:hypothetical protein Fcan01_08691 [Folsomia candida]|uniref:Uncharacterized protein n=1 Tax=Folsomia candida TaxID=158441 RepID=A0A226EF68_FOLCA|nr:hypothetical protein Fcan01_08691 [Folsomia candida]
MRGRRTAQTDPKQGFTSNLTPHSDQEEEKGDKSGGNVNLSEIIKVSLKYRVRKKLTGVTNMTMMVIKMPCNRRESCEKNEHKPEVVIACVLTANAIPGSPAAHHDFAVLSFFGKNLTTEPVFITVMTWIIFDIGMHIGMTILQWRSDKDMQIWTRRHFLFSPIPVLHEKERFDAPGRFARIYMLIAYLVVALVGTVTICTFMLKNSPRGKGLGHMSCTHEGLDNDVREKYEC